MPAKRRAIRKAPSKKRTGRAARPRKAPAKTPSTTRRASTKTDRSTRRKAAFGRSGTAGKGEGDAAVRAWIAGVPAPHRAIVERLDALIAEEVPTVQRAVKWSMPFYGCAGMGWFANVGAFKEHVRLGFFRGTDLRPPLPEGEGKGMRHVKIRGPAGFDEARFRGWIRQAAALQGWGTAR